MGGEKIFIDSQPGSGSSFYFTLDFEKYTESPVNASPVSSDDLSAISGYNILLVEDNLLNAKLALKILELDGNKVMPVENGLMAIEAIKNNKFDIILMDIQMPQMDGHEATKHIRKLNPTVPIIAMTAGIIKGDYEECIASGMNDYISKPISIKELKYKLHKILKSK